MVDGEQLKPLRYDTDEMYQVGDLLEYTQHHSTSLSFPGTQVRVTAVGGLDGDGDVILSLRVEHIAQPNGFVVGETYQDYEYTDRSERGTGRRFVKIPLAPTFTTLEEAQRWLATTNI